MFDSMFDTDWMKIRDRAIAWLKLAVLVAAVVAVVLGVERKRIVHFEELPCIPSGNQEVRVIEDHDNVVHDKATMLYADLSKIGCDDLRLKDKSAICHADEYDIVVTQNPEYGERFFRGYYDVPADSPYFTFFRSMVYTMVFLLVAMICVRLMTTTCTKVGHMFDERSKSGTTLSNEQAADVFLLSIMCLCVYVFLVIPPLRPFVGFFL